MKILLISASPRKKISRTLALARQVLAGCRRAGVKTEVIHLADLSIKFCRHCELCHKKILDCPSKDDVNKVLGKMLKADGIILASPNYINQVTAAMKALFDRASHFIHCKRLLDKYIVGVVSSGGGYDKDVLNYIRYYAHICGAQYSGGVSSRVPVGKMELKKAYALGQNLATDILEEKKFPGQLRIIEKGKEYFKKIIVMRKDEWKQEYKYWKQKGWL
jgi:multimeric flavodoxin WrbA